MFPAEVVRQIKESATSLKKTSRKYNSVVKGLILAYVNYFLIYGNPVDTSCTKSTDKLVLVTLTN